MAKTLVEKLVGRLVYLGISERKAKEIAKGLAPTVRSAVKAETEAKTKKEDLVPTQPILQLDGRGQAVKVDGHMLRLDLPTIPFTDVPPDVDVLRVMHGLSSSHSYLVAAVKGTDGVIAIRRLYENTYNVKFYPTLEYWGVSEEVLTKLGGEYFLARQWYERMHFDGGGVEKLLARYAARKSRTRKLIDRLKAVTIKPLLAAFQVLYTRQIAA